MRQHYWDRLGLILVAGLGAMATAVGGVVAFVTLATLARVVGLSPLLGIPPLRAVPLIYAVVAGGSVLVVLVGLSQMDLLAREDEGAVVACWRSLRALRHRPGIALASGALGVGGLGAVLVVTIAIGKALPPYGVRPIESVQPALWWLFPAVGIAVVAVVATVVGVGRWWLAETSLRPAVSSPSAVPWRTVAVVGLVVMSAVIGAAAIRIADPGADPHRMEPLPEDPATAYHVAVNNTRGVDRRIIWENLTGEARVTSRTVIDFDRPAVLETRRVDGEAETTYAGEGGLASQDAAARYDPDLSHATGGLWEVEPTPAFYNDYALGITPSDALAGGSGRIVSANESTIVVRIESASVLDTLDPVYDVLLTVEPTRGSATVVVDRQAGAIERVRFSVADGDEQPRQYRVTIRSVGETAVARPPGLGPRRPFEWGWDWVLYRSTPIVDR
ncbi:MAG: hypothetical protein ABEJ86_04345 [Halococcoides sp.]